MRGGTVAAAVQTANDSAGMTSVSTPSCEAMGKTDAGTVLVHLPHRPDWRCMVCDTPWPCAVRQADLAAAVQSGNGRAVGLMLMSNVLAAWLDQPDACPGCLVAPFFHWLTDDLYTLMVAGRSGKATLDSPMTHDRPGAPVPRARPPRRNFAEATHVPDCRARRPAPADLAQCLHGDVQQGSELG
jgi:hypothetical protein